MEEGSSVMAVNNKYGKGCLPKSPKRAKVQKKFSLGLKCKLTQNFGTFLEISLKNTWSYMKQPEQIWQTLNQGELHCIKQVRPHLIKKHKQAMGPSSIQDLWAMPPHHPCGCPCGTNRLQPPSKVLQESMGLPSVAYQTSDRSFSNVIVLTGVSSSPSSRHTTAISVEFLLLLKVKQFRAGFA
ncbi:hypothetical protein LXL04_031506 [Taraxacum kok-saghyz]